MFRGRRYCQSSTDCVAFMASHADTPPCRTHKPKKVKRLQCAKCAGRKLGGTLLGLTFCSVKCLKCVIAI